jgi:hypothetical protein
MFVNARIINRKEKKNPSQIIIDTFAVLFSLFLKFPLYVIILFLDQILLYKKPL